MAATGPLKFLLGAAGAVALMTSSFGSAQTVNSGIKAWQDGDFATAVAVWKPLAAKGDADAAFNLAQAYRLGKGLPVNLGAAQSLYEKAARAGHVDAATSLGILLFQNGDRAGAMRWLKQAAVAGEPRALLLYGTALFNGDGVKADPVTAYAYVSRAAAQGLTPARATLADMDAMIPLAQREKGLALARNEAAKTVVRPTAKVAPPKPALLEKVAKTIPASGRWRIQLGAFSKRSSAETLFRSVSGTLSGRQAYYLPVGAVTRLQVGPFANRAEASAACKRLVARGQACFEVPAR
jgi:cell division septation protein DedD